jgi:hypothetical protein
MSFLYTISILNNRPQSYSFQPVNLKCHTKSTLIGKIKSGNCRASPPRGFPVARYPDLRCTALLPPTPPLFITLPAIIVVIIIII